MNITRHRGVAAVEFALVLPLLLLLLFGIIEFSIALYDKALITNASREAARYGVVAAGASVKKTETEIKARAKKYYCGEVITFGTSNCDPNTGAGVTVTYQSGTATTRPAGNWLRVKVEYTYEGLLLGSLLSAVGNDIKLATTTEMSEE
ncbi:MAG: pilus assembly protein [Sterolibacterium sp.]|jgi:Flp pilus assembly protein TadG|nr:pilus assembly protein [Sterolibacterium sp.]